MGTFSACLEAATPAAAAPAVVADGSRWAAWSAARTEVVVYDDRTQRRRRVSVPDCPLTGVGGGRIVLGCPGAPAPLPVVVDVRTGRRTELPGVERHPAFLEGTTTWVGVGAEGLLAHIVSARSRAETGYDAIRDQVLGLDDPRTAIDLDRPRLQRSLCAPLRRTRMPDDPTGQRGMDPYVPLAYDRPWAVENVPVYRTDDDVLLEDAMVRARRCGSRRPRVLARRCGCTASLGAGLVAWRHRPEGEPDPRRVRAVDLATGRRRAWRVGSRQEVAQAGRTLVVWSASLDGSRSPSRLRMIRWPRRAPASG